MEVKIIGIEFFLLVAKAFGDDFHDDVSLEPVVLGAR